MCLSVAAIAQKPYFQQEVNTLINVTLDDVNHTVSGNIEIQYINNSPDDLTEIYFLMFGNAFKDRKSAFAKQKEQVTLIFSLQEKKVVVIIVM